MRKKRKKSKLKIAVETDQKDNKKKFMKILFAAKDRGRISV